MKILVVSTKSPWPPRDGGRLVLWQTMIGLHAAGHALRLVAPIDADDPPTRDDLAMLQSICEPRLVPVRRRRWAGTIASALRQRRALTVVRHQHPAMSDAVSAVGQAWRPDIVHAEQLQAFTHCGAAAAAGLPVLLRMQNVESSLWRQVARRRWTAALLSLEATRLRRDERRALRDADAMVALTVSDRDALADGGQAPVAIAPAFPAQLPSSAPVVGDPAVVLAGSSGWWPNTDAQRWFLAQVRAPLLAALPSARIHLHGGTRVDLPGVHWHPAPMDSGHAFPAQAIAVVPLRIGSGIRMRILEAWARGLPVIASGVAAAGLDVADGRELLVADSPSAFVQCLLRLHGDAGLRASLVDHGRAYLRRHHDPATQTRLLVAQYDDARRRHR